MNRIVVLTAMAFTLFPFMKITQAVAAPLKSCLVIANDAVDFSKQTNDSPVPDTAPAPGGRNNSDSDFCTLTKAGTGGAQLLVYCRLHRVDKKWYAQAGSGTDTATCEATCFNLVCK